MIMSNKKDRSRIFVGLWYLEDETHKQAFEWLTTKSGWDYIYCVHDKDFDENGVIKKSHVHVVIRFKNARYLNSIASTLGIKPNYIQKSSNVDNAVTYLIHLNDPDKFRYSVDECHGTMVGLLKELVSKTGKTESESVSEIFGYIDNFDGILDYNILVKWIVENGYWSFFRRASLVFIKYLENRNFKLLNKKV